MSNRGTANLLTRTTAFLAIGFFATSLLLSWIASLNRTRGTVAADRSTSAPISQPGAPTPVTPSGSGLLDTLKQQDQKQAPSGPQVPRSQ